MLSRTVIKARRLIDGVGEESIEDPILVVEGGLIREVHTRGEEPQIRSDDEVILLGDCTILPGLIDSHIHMTLGTSENYYEVVRESDGIHLAAGITNCRSALRSGITSIVDAGSRNLVAHDLREAEKRGIIEAPNLIIAGRPLTITGGHFWFCNDNEADGIEQVLRRVRQFVKEGIDILKLMASGGGSATQGSMGGPTAAMVAFSKEELETAVKEAHKFGRITTAHCEAYESVYNAASAGVDVLAHCGFIRPDGERSFDDEAVKLMAEKKLFYNPTLQTGSARYDELKTRNKMGSLSPKEKEALEVLEYKFNRKYENLRKMLAYGVEIVAGSDSTGLGKSTRLLRTLEIMHESGMSPIQVIKSATSNAAKALKIENKVGSIHEGLRADLIVVEGDPAKEISDLKKTKLVMKSGRIVK